jgi:hypothetical protein
LPEELRIDLQRQVNFGSALAIRVGLVRRLASIGWLSALAISWDSPCFADNSEQRLRQHLLDQVRFGFDANMASGSRIVGVGSRERYRSINGDLELFLTRFFSKSWGFEFGLSFVPPIPDRDTVFVRGETGVDVALGAWRGALPGSWIVGAGIGGDLGRYSYAGRGYPYAMTRVRIWPSHTISLQLQTEVVPVSIGSHLPTWEQRVEFARVWVSCSSVCVQVGRFRMVAIPCEATSNKRSAVSSQWW